jgi:hypothetical protein
LFERAHHRRIAAVLSSLDPLRLVSNGCLFGGGTAIALRYGEYRESIDIDFLVSYREGYRMLRQWLSGPQGVNALTRPGHPLLQTRELRADQYGLRTLLKVDDTEIKFEILLEARIELAAPAAQDAVCGVASLTPLDLLTSKLLANSDRWADDAVLSRYLIDMAMMQPPKPLMARAIAKAETAYGSSVRNDLAKAIDALRRRPHRLEQCMKAMHIDSVPKAVLWARIKALQPKEPPT